MRATDEATVRACAGCGVPLASNRAPGLQRKWCSERCRKRTLYSGTCAECGAPTYGSNAPPPQRCNACNGHRQGEANRAEWEPYRRLVERMWAEGMTAREIGAVFGWSWPATKITQLRSRGYDLPYRRTAEARARMLVGADERMAKARAARGKGCQ